MTHTMRPIQQSQSVLRRAVRSGAGAVCALVLVLLVAAPVWAARVTEVRVGRHDEFTRVVFELDSHSGYRVERVRGASGPELRVTLDAAARGQTIPFRTKGITKVVVEPGASAVAHITLREEGTRVKEMILASPPRIVLDVMKANTVAVAKKPAPKPEPKVAKQPEPKPAPVVKKPEPKPAPKVAKQPEPKPAPVVKQAEPKPAPVARKPEPKPAPKVAKQPEPEPAPKVAKQPEPEPAPKVAKTPAPRPLPVQPEPPKPEPLKVAKAEPAPTPAPAPAIDPEEEAAELEKARALGLTLKGDGGSGPGDSEPAAAEEKKPAEKLAKTELAPTVVQPKTELAPTVVQPKPEKAAKVVQPKPADAPQAAKAKTPAPAPAPAAVKDGTLFGVDTTLLAAAGGGLLLLLVGFLLMRRRRTLPNDLDVMAIADESGDRGTGSLMDEAPHDPLAEMPHATSSADSSSPLASLFDDEAGGASPGASAARPKTPPPPPSGGPALDDLFDTQAAPQAVNEPAADANAATTMGDPTMNQGMSDLPADPDRMASTQSPVGSAAPDSDVLRVVHELERRMQQLESKLAEANEARERLERQVAAQSEELRVQRAAIARTQRALRTMSRGDEDKATEPALRDPNSDTQTQAKTRVATE